jgi:hypothetical protein
LSVLRIFLVPLPAFVEQDSGQAGGRNDGGLRYGAIARPLADAAPGRTDL